MSEPDTGGHVHECDEYELPADKGDEKFAAAE